MKWFHINSVSPNATGGLEAHLAQIDIERITSNSGP